jgi:hypothetical protein
MAKLPNAEWALLDIRKLADYCLSPVHPRGRHKARVFRDALDLSQDGSRVAAGGFTGWAAARRGD